MQALSFHAKAFPFQFTAMQKLVVGQETDERPPPFESIKSGGDQALPFHARDRPRPPPCRNLS